MMLAARVLIIATAIASSGCVFGTLAKRLDEKAQKDARDRLDTARRARDVAHITEQCKNDGTRTSEVACEYKRQIELEDNKDCAAIAAGYKSASSDPDQMHYKAMVKRFAGCGNYVPIFEKMYDRSSWKILTEGNFPVADEAVKYMQSHPGPKLFADLHESEKGRAMRDMIGSLVELKQTQHCDVIADSVKDAHHFIQSASLAYFQAGRCAAGIPVAVSLLLDTEWEIREWACETLGDFGDPSVLNKLEILAKTDKHHELQEKRESDGSGERFYAVKVYPVRDACTEAVGKIRLRTAE